MKSSGKYTTLTGKIILILAFISLAFLGVINPVKEQPSLGAIAAKVDGIEIRREDFLRRYQRILSYYKQFQGEDLDPASLGLAKNVLKSMVDELAWYETARQNGALASIEEISSKIVEQQSFYDKDGKFSKEIMQEVLRQNGLTESTLAEEIRFQLSSNKLRQHISNQVFVSSQIARLDDLLKKTKVAVSYVKIEAENLPVTVTEEQAKKFLEAETAEKEVSVYYNKNKGDYQSPEEFKLSQILVSYKGAEKALAGTARSKEEALKQAEKILVDLKAAPETFATRATQESDDQDSKMLGGDLGFLELKEMPKALNEVAKKLKKGEFSGVVESPFGYHLVRMEDKKQKKNISLEKAKASIAKKILEDRERYKKSNDVAKEILDLLKNGKSAEALLSQYNLKWEITPETSLNARSIPSYPEEFMEAAINLEKTGDLHPRVINKFKVNYLVKLASKKKIEVKELTEKEILATREDLKEQNERDSIFYFEKLISEAIRDKNKHDLYINPQYEALDNPKS
jgi:peptidyl-prolyl cis-trans isomerase D